MTTLLPIIKNKILLADKLQLTLEVPANLYYLQGHFQDYPVVPGVVQLSWVVTWAKELLLLDAPIKGLETIKFQHILQPSQLFELELHVDRIKNKLLFEYRDEHKVFSSGRLLLGSEARV